MPVVTRAQRGSSGETRLRRRGGGLQRSWKRADRCWWPKFQVVRLHTGIDEALAAFATSCAQNTAAMVGQMPKQPASPVSGALPPAAPASFTASPPLSSLQSKMSARMGYSLTCISCTWPCGLPLMQRHEPDTLQAHPHPPQRAQGCGGVLSMCKPQHRSRKLTTQFERRACRCSP